MRILLVNDDGWNADGIVALWSTLKPHHDVFLVAPDRERSAVSHSFSLHQPIRLKQVDTQMFHTTGTPADCVYIALRHVMPTMPDLVISGVNNGPNLGQDVFYSGTVAGAREAAIHGIPALAVSVVGKRDFTAAAHRVAEMVEHWVEKFFLVSHISHAQRNYLLNINLADPISQSPFVVTRLGHRNYDAAVEMRYDPRGGQYFWIGGPENDPEQAPDSDIAAVQTGRTSITPLSLDNTEYDVFEILAGVVAHAAKL